jgi:hypothetical protein
MWQRLVAEIKDEATLWITAGAKHLSPLVSLTVSEYSFCLITSLAHAPKPG